MNRARTATASRVHIDPNRISEFTKRRIAEILYPAILEDSKKPEFQEGLKRWKAEQGKEGLHAED